MIRRLFIYFLLIQTVFLAACRNYYNETIKWADSIHEGTSIDSVKLMQPSFIEIDWSNPKILEQSKLYEIVKIKNNHDILNMQHFLVFKNNKYVMRSHRK